MVENQHFISRSAAPENLGDRAVLDTIEMLVKGFEPPTYALRMRCRLFPHSSYEYPIPKIQAFS